MISAHQALRCTAFNSPLAAGVVTTPVVAIVLLFFFHSLAMTGVVCCCRYIMVYKKPDRFKVQLISEC